MLHGWGGNGYVFEKMFCKDIRKLLEKDGALTKNSSLF
jgi:hypothetical protein